MRILFIITCLANIAFALGSLPWMPSPMAIHFGLDGTPNGFAHPITYAMSMSIFVGIVAVLFPSISLVTARTPSSWINIPNRNYWLNEENRPKTLRRLCSSIELCGIAMMLVLLFMQWEFLRASQKVPPKLNNGFFWFGICLLLVFITIEHVRLYLSFRLPTDKDSC